jgi:hypothetical protein
LPFLLNSDFNTGETSLTLGKKNYTHYEDVLEELIASSSYPNKFHAKKGMY